MDVARASKKGCNLDAKNGRVPSWGCCGDSAGTDERAIVPALEALEGLLAAKREVAEQKALLALDSILESKGATPVVEVALELGGREIADPEALERHLDELRSRILHELEDAPWGAVEGLPS